MTLLTIGDVGDDTVGGTADAFLEVKPGSGRIFLDSFPLTKIDTQISTRYASKIACDYLDRECSGLDFFYTIRAGSTIVGGPSASASLTILTIAALEGIELDNETVMTGTINSGGSIGPVGGILQKARAAEKAGFERVLIPMFSINLRERTNKTNITEINISEHSQANGTVNETSGNNTKTNITNESVEDKSLDEDNLSIEVIRVSNIDDALVYFTDRIIEQPDGEIVVPEDYTSTMKDVAEKLCERALELKKKTRPDDEKVINKSEEFESNINKGFEDQDYYSAASYCFSLGLLLRKTNLEEIEDKYPERIGQLYNLTKRAVEEFDKNLENKNLTTLSELETYIIVKERLVEAEESLNQISANISTNELAYAIERYYSAVFWSTFFRLKGERFELDPEYLKEACYKKLSEAEERINYAGIYVPLPLQNSGTTIKQAYAFALQENYKMCLFKASFAKAESNLLLSSITFGKDQVNELAEEKLKSAKKVIVKEQSRNVFPILGYSYYEYATSLKENGDPLSSLIFGEYALELSNIEIYFPKKSIIKLPRINYSAVYFYLSALVLGVAVGLLIGSKVLRRKGKKKVKVKKKKKK